jgi:hypothetical protein
LPEGPASSREFYLGGAEFVVEVVVYGCGLGQCVWKGVGGGGFASAGRG